jgi:hypothetical protein
VCGCVGVWVCGCVGVWVCGCVVVCACVRVWVFFRVCAGLLACMRVWVNPTPSKPTTATATRTVRWRAWMWQCARVRACNFCAFVWVWLHGGECSPRSAPRLPHLRVEVMHVPAVVLLWLLLLCFLRVCEWLGEGVYRKVVGGETRAGPHDLPMTPLCVRACGLVW